MAEVITQFKVKSEEIEKELNTFDAMIAEIETKLKELKERKQQLRDYYKLPPVSVRNFPCLNDSDALILLHGTNDDNYNYRNALMERISKIEPTNLSFEDLESVIARITYEDKDLNFEDIIKAYLYRGCKEYSDMMIEFLTNDTPFNHKDMEGYGYPRDKEILAYHYRNNLLKLHRIYGIFDLIEEGLIPSEEENLSSSEEED